MNGIKQTIKIFLKNFSQKFSVAEDIDSDEQFKNTKKWVKKASKSFKRHSIAAIIFTIFSTILCGTLITQEMNVNGVGGFFVTVLLGAIYLFTFEFAFLGMATMKMHFKEVAKNAWSAAKFGYEVGEKIQTTHVDVTHEYGNTYKISSRTESKGLLFAIICASVIMLSWGAYCVYKGSFLTIKKIKTSKQKLAEYKNA